MVERVETSYWVDGAKRTKVVIEWFFLGIKFWNKKYYK